MEGRPLETYNAIQKWLEYLVKNGCFCPNDSERPFHVEINVCCYISSGGKRSGVSCERSDETFGLRVNTSDKGNRLIENAVADTIFKLFKDEFVQFAHPFLVFLQLHLRRLAMKVSTCLQLN